MGGKDDFRIKFLPAEWVPETGSLSVHGYIQVFMKVGNDTKHGTVWIKGNNGEEFTARDAKVICEQAGYAAEKGDYSKGTYDVEGDRSSINGFISGLHCNSKHHTISECTHDPFVMLNSTTTWDHKEDVALKCVFK